MSVNAENTADTSASRDPELIKEPTNGILHEFIDIRIKANLGPLNEEISALTQLRNQLIQERPARNSPTADTLTQQTQSRRSPSQEAETSRVEAFPAREIWSTGFPLDKHRHWIWNTHPDSRRSWGTDQKLHRSLDQAARGFYSADTKDVEWPSSKPSTRVNTSVNSSAAGKPSDSGIYHDIEQHCHHYSLRSIHGSDHWDNGHTKAAVGWIII